MDSRDYAAMTGGDRDSRFTFTIYHDNDSEEEISVPTHWEVCPVCNGQGTHVNPSIDAHGITADEFHEDPDFEGDYFSGVYDQTCNECHGRTTVRAPNWDAMSQEHQDAYQRQCDDLNSMYAEMAAERRMGA